jgi:DNA-binding FrmR family transcriptional regulator
MNCLLEAVASLWLSARRQVVTEHVEEEVMTAQEGLEQCRRNMEGREHELQAVIQRLGEEALAKKREGDVTTARAKLVERRRCGKRLERLRHGLELVDSQLDAIKTSELDKEIMLTLKASTAAMRKAGINLGVHEVESVMTELDEQMREVQDITSVLATPMLAGGGGGAEEADLDAELDLLEAVIANPDTPSRAVVVSPPVAPSNTMRVPVGEPSWPARPPGALEAVV